VVPSLDTKACPTVPAGVVVAGHRQGRVVQQVELVRRSVSDSNFTSSSTVERLGSVTNVLVIRQLPLLAVLTSW
jgi:tartrate dehydratase alpha subunit/fumarate hydratase class I-like protein